MGINSLPQNQGDVTINSIESAPGPIINGQKTVATAGNDEPLVGSPTLVVSGVTVKALAGNTTAVYVGASGVSAVNGHPLSPGDDQFIETDDLAKVFVDADTNGEGVSFIATGVAV